MIDERARGMPPGDEHQRPIPPVDAPGPIMVDEDSTTPATVPGTALGSAEAVALGAGLAVVVVAIVSLLLADLGRHSLTAVALAAGSLLVAAAVTVVLVSPRPRMVADLRGWVVVIGVGALAMVLSFPGFPYEISHRDPGIYVVHAQVIAREGTTSFDDEVLAADLPERVMTPTPRWGGYWTDRDDADAITPQFFHLYPALLATAFDVGGSQWLLNVNPLLAVLAAVAVALAVRRAFGFPAGLIAGVLLASCMLQVWQAKYPTTEMLAQALLAVALLAGAVAAETGWRPPAALAGVLVTAGFLVRPDGLLLLVAGIGLAAALVATRHADARVGWFTAGMAAPLPLAALHAWHWNERYGLANGLPGLGSVALVMGALLVGALVWRWTVQAPIASRWARTSPHRRRWAERVAGGVLAVAALAFLSVLSYREELFGPERMAYRGNLIRSFDEINLQRLGWFVTRPGLVLMGIGIVVLCISRWRMVQWLVVAPGVLVLPLYLWEARISPQLMWWGRRFVPAALVGIILLIAVGLSVGFRCRGRWRPLGAIASTAATLALLAVFLGQSWPLRTHHELAGSVEVVDQVVAVAGDHRGVFLWARRHGGPLAPTSVGATVAYGRDRISALLSPRHPAAAVRAFETAFPDEPVFVIMANGNPPPAQLRNRLTEVAAVRAELPQWEEVTGHRPDGLGAPYRVDLTIWRVDPAG